MERKVGAHNEVEERAREELAKGNVFSERKGGIESLRGEEEALTLCDLG